MTKPANSYVYVIGSANGPYKVGKANSVKDRLSSIQTGSHVAMIVHHSVMVPHDLAIKIEKRAHKNLEFSRIKGEWFDVGLTMAVAAVAESTAHFLSEAVTEPEPEPEPSKPPSEAKQQSHFDVAGVSFVKRLSLREYAEIQAARPLSFSQRMAEAKRRKANQPKTSASEAASVSALQDWLSKQSG